MRIKAATTRRTRKKKYFKLAKGAYAGKSKKYRQVLQHVEKSLDRAYTGRKDRKGNFRRLWISRLNAACREEGLTYSKLIAGLKKADLRLNRKMLAEIALRDTGSFKKIVSIVKPA
ncbi:MAG: 50S ribosomal protein L20 [Elusimicrobiota bacterium]